MDKNTLTGIVLIGAIFVAFLYLNKSDEKKIENNLQDANAQTEVSDNTEINNADSLSSRKEIEENSVIDSNNLLAKDSSELELAKQLVLDQENINKYGIFASATSGKKEYYTLKNNKIELKISSLGARIADVKLIEKQDGKYKYKTHKDFISNKEVPLKMFDEEFSSQSVQLVHAGRRINTGELFFSNENINENEIVLVLKTNVDNKFLKYTYKLEEDRYEVDYTIEFINLDSDIDLRQADFVWSMTGLSTEKLADDERMTATTMFRYFGEGRDYFSERGSDEHKINGKLNWLAFKTKFFSSILISDDGFTNGSFSQEQLESTDYTIKYNADINLPAHNRIDLKFFFGPNDYDLLSTYDNEMEDIINTGWGIFGWVNKIMINPIFNLLKSTGWSYGLIILLVTLIVKIIILPLTYKNYKSSAKMKVLKPEIERMGKKYEGKSDKDTMMKKQKETMALYKSTGVNPMAGCIPMLIQMPILIAVFRFFPSSLDLRHKGFLWAEDLSSFDSIYDLGFNIPMYGDHISLFTLLMAASTLLYTVLNSNQMAPSQPGMPNMKVIMYIFPFMMIFFFNTYSSGLSFYYLCGNMMNLGIMWAIKKYMIDENKIKLQIEENKKKPKKKSKFQKKMEELSKQQQKKRR